MWKWGTSPQPVTSCGSPTPTSFPNPELRVQFYSISVLNNFFLCNDDDDNNNNGNNQL